MLKQNPGDMTLSKVTDALPSDEYIAPPYTGPVSIQRKVGVAVRFKQPQARSADVTSGAVQVGHAPPPAVPESRDVKPGKVVLRKKLAENASEDRKVESPPAPAPRVSKEKSEVEDIVREGSSLRVQAREVTKAKPKLAAVFRKGIREPGEKRKSAVADTGRYVDISKPLSIPYGVLYDVVKTEAELHKVTYDEESAVIRLIPGVNDPHGKTVLSLFMLHLQKTEPELYEKLEGLSHGPEPARDIRAFFEGRVYSGSCQGRRVMVATSDLFGSAFIAMIDAFASLMDDASVGKITALDV